MASTVRRSSNKKLNLFLHKQSKKQSNLEEKRTSNMLCNCDSDGVQMSKSFSWGLKINCLNEQICKQTYCCDVRQLQWITFLAKSFGMPCKRHFAKPKVACLDEYFSSEKFEKANETTKPSSSEVLFDHDQFSQSYSSQTISKLTKLELLQKPTEKTSPNLPFAVKKHASLLFDREPMISVKIQPNENQYASLLLQKSLIIPKKLPPNNNHCIIERFFCSLDNPCPNTSDCMSNRCCRMLNEHRCSSGLSVLSFPHECIRSSDCPIGAFCDQRRCCPINNIINTYLESSDAFFSRKVNLIRT